MTNKEDVEFPIYVFDVDDNNLHKFLTIPVKAWFRDMINDFPMFIWNQQIKAFKELKQEMYDAGDGGVLAPIGETILWYDKWLSQFDELREKLRYDTQFTCPECGTWEVTYEGTLDDNDVNMYDCKCCKCSHEFKVDYQYDR